MRLDVLLDTLGHLLALVFHQLLQVIEQQTVACQLLEGEAVQVEFPVQRGGQVFRGGVRLNKFGDFDRSYTHDSSRG